MTQDAIRLNKAGKPIPVDDLPTPPGFAPIPVGGVPPQGHPKPAAAAGTYVTCTVMCIFINERWRESGKFALLSKDTTDIQHVPP